MSTEPIYSIYLSGKITGDPNYMEKFAIVAQELRISYPNAKVFNPARELNGISDSLKKAGINEKNAHDILLEICLKVMEEYEAIAFMPDWGDSEGATLEVVTALRRKMKMIQLSEEWLP